ncbi:hypothetical protein ACFWDI_28400 [Streptomyces sp. NPDC060064]|uniref:hypothetical protein n=1 Tax=Streptomyces sp. NPDC060064 TaxID=3347049 RepID=UPI0036994E8C
MYGIDLEEDEISAARYFSLAHRAPAYTGVMSARAEAQREEQENGGRRSAPAERRPTPKQQPEQYQSVTALAARFPEEIELVKVGD